MKLLIVVVLFVIFQQCYADVYMHMPRGSNNRLNGRGQNRANNNRMCDTQNNAKGGYCWGPPLYYYTGSKLMVEWTNQHACNNPKVVCNIILQYMCGPEVRDGTTTDTIPDNAGEYNEQVSPDPLTGEEGPVYKYGMHESFQYYQDCKERERNKGLFTADQNMNNRNSARHTRQDNNGNRNGFECPEERDYYPYWHPTPWKDIAILVSNTSRCEFFKNQSQNVRDKNFCSNMEFNNQIACENNNGVWETQPSWGIDPPICEQAQWTRTNHLGNSAKHDFHEGYASSFNWTIPETPEENCVLRLRYNISTTDYEGWTTPFVDHRWNGDDLSPIKQDEIVPYFGHDYEMALNTDQLGRTFQDRSHIFHIRERPRDIPDEALIWNVGVRGKRGNIVQVYPAVEYDFVPNLLHVSVGDYIHYQWTGCDTNPNNNDGEGTQATDRSNIAQMRLMGDNYPTDKPDIRNQMFDSDEVQTRMAFIDQVNCLSYEALREKNNNNQNAIEQDIQNCMKLNAAPTPYFDGGIMRLNRTGTFYFFCTRNNNFSNRSQKATLVVTYDEDKEHSDDWDSDNTIMPVWSLMVIGVAGAVFAASAIVGGILLFAKSHPGSAVTSAINKL
eukprot:TRINITY_DN34_c1_g1_i1.p1 TRINITY_DN34_c1_g1~~TRINITY_DN34_c1_g1_i1.p1  ORF type:complete len:613 (-),score=261.56 TRINITY_DN34_c1_g1_i1:227-2065(-)